SRLVNVARAQGAEPSARASLIPGGLIAHHHRRHHPTTGAATARPIVPTAMSQKPHGAADSGMTSKFIPYAPNTEPTTAIATVITASVFIVLFSRCQPIPPDASSPAA